MARNARPPHNEGDSTDPRIPSSLWYLAGNRGPAPTSAQYNALRHGDTASYASANPETRLVPDNVAPAPPREAIPFSLNPLSPRRISAFSRNARIEARKGVAAERAEDSRARRLERKLKKLKARNKALKAALVGTDAAAAFEAETSDSSDDDCDKHSKGEAAEE